MKNTIIITGPADSGKTRMIKALAKESEIVFLTESHLKSPFAFEACSTKTEFIVIDDVSNLETKELKGIGFCDKLQINLKGKPSLAIDRPTLIIILDEPKTENQ